MIKTIENVTKPSNKSYKEYFDEYLRKYEYQEQLTKKLDHLIEPLNENDINEMTLWKVNRYPIITGSYWYFEDEFNDGDFTIYGLAENLRDLGLKIPKDNALDYINDKVLTKKNLYKDLKSAEPQNNSDLIQFNRNKIDEKYPGRSTNRRTLIDRLNQMRAINDLENAKKYKQVIKALLKCHGVQMAMASTYLRFLKPDIFQIIDKRAYRALGMGKLDLSKDPVKIYFDYLENLKEKCVKFSIPFFYADRILYEFDKDKNEGYTIDWEIKKTKK